MTFIGVIRRHRLGQNNSLKYALVSEYCFAEPRDFCFGWPHVRSSHDAVVGRVDSTLIGIEFFPAKFKAFL